MQFGKKNSDGFRDRLSVITKVKPSVADKVESIRSWARGKGVARDDILDAMVAAITASAAEESWLTFPPIPSQDQYGLPMEMVYVPCRDRAPLTAPDQPLKRLKKLAIAT